MRRAQEPGTLRKRPARLLSKRRHVALKSWQEMSFAERAVYLFKEGCSPPEIAYATDLSIYDIEAIGDIYGIQWRRPRFYR